MARRSGKFGLEPEFPLSKHDAIELSNEVLARRLRSPNARTLRLFGTLCFLLLWLVPGMLLMIGLPIGWAIVGGLAVFIACGFGFRAFLKSDHDRECRTELRERGHDLCVECGYWLRGPGDDVKHCPECGAEREPIDASARNDSNEPRP